MINLAKVLSLVKRKGSEPSLKEKFKSFQNLLRANNRALETMGDMEEKYSSDEYLFDRQYIRAGYKQIRDSVFEMVESLNQMVPDRFTSLFDIFNEVDLKIKQRVYGTREIQKFPFTLSLKEVTQDLMDQVGGKNANLGEMRNRVSLPIPLGFAITSYAYKVFIEENKLAEEITKQLEALDSRHLEAITVASKKVQQSILLAKIPPSLERAILDSYDRLVAEAGGEIPISIRSSAVG
ncbi:MAG TPA: PEP/pyruvate-binding domain-containing protein, partial [Thermodesulfobacteriota bacterium]|nr:PEP/pyruvate-binding domain-containing protein [Thermodesulfobacteriota bacterium]